jgi:hypothetical protein
LPDPPADPRRISAARWPGDGTTPRQTRIWIAREGAPGATAISRPFQLALAWLALGAALGAAPPVLGVAIIAALNAYYWLPIRGESPRPKSS